MIHRLPLFDWSLKRQAANPKKIHAVDTGLAAVARGFAPRDSGKMLETVVVNELIRRGGDLYYGKISHGLEIDCIVLKDGRIELMVQVCQEMNDPKTRHREIRALGKAAGEIPHAQDARLMILTPGPREWFNRMGARLRL